MASCLLRPGLYLLLVMLAGCQTQPGSIAKGGTVPTLSGTATGRPDGSGDFSFRLASGAACSGKFSGSLVLVGDAPATTTATCDKDQKVAAVIYRRATGLPTYATITLPDHTTAKVIFTSKVVFQAATT